MLCTTPLRAADRQIRNSVSSPGFWVKIQTHGLLKTKQECWLLLFFTFFLLSPYFLICLLFRFILFSVLRFIGSTHTYSPPPPQSVQTEEHNTHGQTQTSVPWAGLEPTNPVSKGQDPRFRPRSLEIPCDTMLPNRNKGSLMFVVCLRVVSFNQVEDKATSQTLSSVSTGATSYQSPTFISESYSSMNTRPLLALLTSLN
jgi:hypothetical protein